MKLPWSDDGKIEELERKIESLEEEKERLENRFEAEKQRRSELSRKKQGAEEKINRLEDRIHGLESGDEDEPEEEDLTRMESIGFEQGYRILEKLASVGSPRRDLVTVFSPGKVEDIEDLKGLKNTVTLEQLELLQRNESFIAFLDQDLFQVVLKTRPFFDAEWVLSDQFNAESVLEFIDSEKTWVLVSAGETQVFTEAGGDYELVEEIKSRVDRKHSKGGFSQDRFERKREEQIEQHLEEVEDALEGYENIYLLGQKELCDDLPGEYRGGFDPNMSAPEVFYSFRLIR